MENASKALIMAASVLIGIMVLSLAVYLFATFGASSAQMHEQIQIDRTNQFNAQFTVYQNMTNITIYDVVTVANTAKNNNEYYGLTTSDESNYYITVQLGNTYIEGKDDNYFNSLIQADINTIQRDPTTGTAKEMPTYTCQVTISDITGLVKTVKFTKNN